MSAIREQYNGQEGHDNQESHDNQEGPGQAIQKKKIVYAQSKLIMMFD